MSSFGCGPFGMIQSFTVVPGDLRRRGLALGAAAPVLVIPAAARERQAPTRIAAIASATSANLLLTILSSLRKTIL